MGLLVGTVLYPIISATKRHRIIVWIFRLAAIPLAVILFIVLIRNFYKSDPYAGNVVCNIFSIEKAHDCTSLHVVPLFILLPDGSQ